MPETDNNWLESKLGGLPESLKSAVTEVTTYRGDVTLVVEKSRVRDVIKHLKTNATLPFNMMMDLFSVDYLKWSPVTPERFAVIYNLYSFTRKERVIVKVWVSETNPEIDSIHDIFLAANWFEREAWDMFGVVFKGHPNLIRILCHNEFVGHPLRKDYPSDKYQRLKSSAPSSEI